MDAFHYKVSVIVPVYNAEKTLSRTMESLFAQTMPQKQMEIILINDGSKDGSAALCDGYAAKHPNVRAIHQENAGVSTARNTGIQAAQGKYLLYLDGDDTLSPESLANIVGFFDAHYDQVDLVTYPLLNVYENGKTDSHWRYSKYLTETGIYPLDKYPFVAQTTINVCVKNSRENQLFDTSMALVEDQLHNTILLSRKAVLGFVKEAEYRYMRSNASSSSVKLAPMYSFDAYNIAHQQFLDIAERNPSMRRYCESLVLYNINWKLGAGVLLPHHLSGEAYEEAMSAFVDILHRIPNRNILSFPHMKKEHKYYLFPLKTKNRPFVYPAEDAYVVVDASGQLEDAARIFLVVTRSRLENGTLYLLGHAKCLVTDLLRDEVTVFAVINGTKRIQMNTFESVYSRYHTKLKTNSFPAFHFELDLDKVKTLSFEVCFYGRTYATNLWFMKTQGLDKDPQYYLTDGRYKVTADETTMSVEVGRFFPQKPKANAKISLCRALMGHGDQRVWLYCDKNGVWDNGYFQFKRDFRRSDGIKRYYVYDDDRSKIEAAFTPDERKWLVKFNSPRHKILFSQAEYVLTSFVDAIYFRPFDLDTFRYYRGACSAKIIYLQHGILHAKGSHYSKESLEVDKVVISGGYEKEVFVKECGFQEGDLIPSGMPRLDNFDRGRVPEKKLLYAPSWRGYLTNGQDNRRWSPVSEDALKKSTFFQGVVRLLRDEGLLAALKRQGYSIELKLHPIFEMYREVFQRELPHIYCAPSNVELESYAGFITDFSSFLYDFAYLNRPIFYYVPDLVEFQSGLNGYCELYIPLEEGLGYFTSDAEAMAKALIGAVSNGFEVEPVYLERMNHIFYSYEPSHSEQLYQYLYTGESK